MNPFVKPLAIVAACTVLALPRLATAQTAPAIPPALITPDKVETRIGTLDFKDGMPSKDSVAKVYDNLNFAHAFQAFVNTYQGVSIELSPKVGDGGNRKGGISWGCLTPPLLHRRSDMPCPKITSSS